MNNSNIDDDDDDLMLDAEAALKAEIGSIPLSWRIRSFFERLVSKVWLAEATEETAASFRPLLPLAGWGFLVFTIIKLILIILPMDLMDIEWEFETLEKIVDQSIYILLSFVCILSLKPGEINYFYLCILHYSTWVCFLLGVIFLLTAPLGIVDTTKIYKDLDKDSLREINDQHDYFKKIHLKINESKKVSTLKKIAKRVKSSSAIKIRLKLKSKQRIDELKMWLVQRARRYEKIRINEIKKDLYQDKKELLETSAKFNIGLIVLGILFIGVWSRTGWIRGSFRNIGSLSRRDDE